MGLVLAPSGTRRGPFHAMRRVRFRRWIAPNLDFPLKPGRLQTMTHDYKRNGTTTLFAALNTLDGRIIGECMHRHTHREWLRFLKLLDAETPADKTLHVIAENYATHKHPKVQRWLQRHPACRCTSPRPVLPG